MKEEIAREAVFTVGMVASAVYTLIRGETLLPSLVGGMMAVAFRIMYDKDTDEKFVSKWDYVTVFFVSVSFGMIAGPYVADQLPEGKGSVGVGTMIASFLGVAFLKKLHKADWDIVETFSQIAKSFVKKKDD